MRFYDEIKRAVNHINANAAVVDKKRPEDLDRLIDECIEAVKSGGYDFTKAQPMLLNQGGKKRYVKVFDEFSCENILCHCVKRILDKSFSIKYPNRNKSIRALFDTIKAACQMSDFTMLKFDFKDYFNSVSSDYVFRKYISRQISERFEHDLIKDYVEKTKYAYAGLCTSNVIAEIIAKTFDEKVKMEFSAFGILFFERYIDDSIIVLNTQVDECACKDILSKLLDEVYHDKSTTSHQRCRTRFNDKKFIYISRRSLSASASLIDFLGYEFSFRNNNDNIETKYGITCAKRDKYSKRVDEFINAYLGRGKIPTEKDNLELLRHRILAFTRRTVYVNKRFNSSIWKVKGFVSNYGELRYLTEQSKIDSKTLRFLANMITDAFRKAGLDLPYFIKGSQKKNPDGSTEVHDYCLLPNLKSNKTLLLVEHIGISKQTLERMCRQIGISLTAKGNGEGDKARVKGYGELVRDYLIWTKVGY